MEKEVNKHEHENENNNMNENENVNNNENNEKVIVLNEPSDEMYICTDLPAGQLPAFLEEAIGVVDTPAMQDMLLLSDLTALSYALPHIKMLHNNGSKEYYPNLMTLVMAPPASGKGVMTNAQRLIAPIDEFLQAVDSGAIVAADSSSVTFFESLQECGGNAFMMATEIDELSQAMKKDGGSYSSLFRQAFEHEKWMRTRYRGQNRVRFVVEQPRLSVLLSGTEDQLKPLLKRGENGLASRFIAYLHTDSMLFDESVLEHGDQYNPNGAALVYDRLGAELFERWKWLFPQDHDCLWSLTDEQVDVFGGLVKDAESIALQWLEHYPTSNPNQMIQSMLAVVNRLVVSLKRIGLILSALRLEVGTALPEVIYCNDEDFRTMILMGEKLLRHALRLTQMLVEGESAGDVRLLARTDAAERMENLLAELPERFTTGEAAKIGEEMEIPYPTLNRYLKKLCDERVLLHVGKGKYLKK